MRADIGQRGASRVQWQQLQEASQRSLIEASFGCFDEDDQIDVAHATGAGVHAIRTHDVPLPDELQSHIKKHFSRARSVECYGSGSFYFKSDALADRFLTWRISKSVLVLREWSLHASLAQNAIRLQFAAPIVPTGVHAIESWDSGVVSIVVLTQIGSIHRFWYQVPSSPHESIFARTEDSSDYAAHWKPATASTTERITMLEPEEHVTCVAFVNEYNALLGTETGRVVGVNFGLPSQVAEMQEFVLSDESMAQWLWNGLVRSSRRTTQHWSGQESKGQGDAGRIAAHAIVAMAVLPSANPSRARLLAGSGVQYVEEDDDEMMAADAMEEDDVCVVTLSSDMTLKAWSLLGRSCVGKQRIQDLLDTSGEDSTMSAQELILSAKLIGLPATATDNCRLLMHLDTTERSTQEIFLLRGEVGMGHARRRGFNVDLARVFTVPQAENSRKGSVPSGNKRMKLVDFALDRFQLYSLWRSTSEDFVYVHENPMALTGPRVIPAQLVWSLNAQMKKYEAEDDDVPLENASEKAMQAIDAFFVGRVLLPGRFSCMNLYKALTEYQGSSMELPVWPLFARANGNESRYKELLLRVVADKWLQTVSGSSADGRITPYTANGKRSAPLDPLKLRVGIWKSIIELCTKHWRVESVPIGCVPLPSDGVLPGSPVILRRNRVSLVFPSAGEIVDGFFAQQLETTHADVVRELSDDVLPLFDCFSAHALKSMVHRELKTLKQDEMSVESHVDLARHAVRHGLNGFECIQQEGNASLDLSLARVVLSIQQLLDPLSASAQNHVLQSLLKRLFPVDYSSSASSPRGRHRSAPSDSGHDERMDDADADEEQDDDEDEMLALVPQSLFAGHEVSFAFSQVVGFTIDRLRLDALRVVLLLAYLVEMKPDCVRVETVHLIERRILPQAVTLYRRWELCKWIASQNATAATDLDTVTAKTSATLTPPILQLFLQEANSHLGSRLRFRQMYAAIQDPSRTSRKNDAHAVLATYTRDTLHYLSHLDSNVQLFLQRGKEFRVLRALLCSNLKDMQLKGQVSDRSKQCAQETIRAIAACLIHEGHHVARVLGDEEQATWCFQQAMQRFSAGLPDTFFPADANEWRYVYDIVALLKEKVPRGYFGLIIDFLWSISSRFTSDLGLEAGFQRDLDYFVWLNLFKYTIEERRFREAHLALMRIVSISKSVNGQHGSSDVGSVTPMDEAEIEGRPDVTSAAECVSFLVKELCRSGRSDLVCEFQWGDLEAEVVQQLQWQAANANVLKGNAIDPKIVVYYQLLYAFYLRKSQFANAAAAMYALYLRFRLAKSKLAAVLRAQRNALYACQNALLHLDEPNRWFVRKYHTEELMEQPGDETENNADALSSAYKSLNIVSNRLIEKEIAILDGKLRLLRLGHEESVLLSSIGPEEVTALLVDSTQRCREWTGTQAERRQEGLMAMELAVDIARKSDQKLDNITKSMARSCVSTVHRNGLECMCWQLLGQYLHHVESIEQYQLAATEILNWKVKIKLPLWLYEPLTDPLTGNPAMLLRLFLKHGLLVDAVQLATKLIPTDLLEENEIQFQKRAASVTPHLPWLPYTLVDKVIVAAEQVIASRQCALAKTVPLEAGIKKLKDKLVAYFRYVYALEQARAAACAAQQALGKRA